MNLNLTISCDDVNPLNDYRILGTQVKKWWIELNEKYGVKFTCFIPSNYHNQAPLSKNKEWIKDLNSIPWIECAAHGHFHMTSDPSKFGECEFFELQDKQLIHQRIDMIKNEWANCGIYEFGWRNPGWLASENSVDIIGKRFNINWKLLYSAIHYEHNRGMNWNCKTFFGHDGIDQTNIEIHNINESNPDGMIMFQSHIAGNHNDNVWNQKNFDQLCLSLDYLFENYSIEPKMLQECL